ncbi:MAG: peptidoglycan-binding protein [Rickettsiales bacterium]|nr:peptidoglycan-binding protein [Rickettsiales bacterium]
MNDLFRHISPSQWIMLSTIAVISVLMLLASNAHAGSTGKGTTMGHCGWLSADNIHYTKRSRNVAIIQQKLSDLGYSLGRAGVDGKFGPITRAAIMAFQKDNMLTADGSVGKETASALAYISHPIGNVRRCRYSYAG